MFAFGFFFSVSQQDLATETIFEELVSGTDSSLILGELQELTGIRTHQASPQF